jgi:hypothetical protein
MGKIIVEENNLVIKEGITKKTLMPMDALRLIYVFLPESLKSWFVVSSSSGIEGYELDSVSDGSIEELSRKFDDMIRQERAYKLSGIKLCLADYENHSVIVPLKDFKSSKIDIFSTLLLHRPQRLAKRRQWLNSRPEVVLKGVMGQKAVLDSRGFRRGKKLIAWKDVGTLQIDTVNFSTNLLVIPKGVSSGFFGIKKYQHSLGISLKKKELYIAECNFWMSYLQQETDVPQQLEELALLKEQGILSEEKFQAAKRVLLEKI